jgi:hypothetical protein
MSCDISHLPQSWDWSCLKILRTLSSPQECTPTGLKKLAGTSANIESWESPGILRNPQESCRNHRGTVKTSCKLMADYSRTLVSCRIEVHLIQYELFRLLGINHFHLFAATEKPKLLSALFNRSWPRKEKGGK